MTPSAVLVTFNHPTTNHPESGTGVQFSHNDEVFVLVHGTVFAPLVNETWFMDFLNSVPSTLMETNGQFSNRIPITVIEENTAQPTKMNVKMAWKCAIVSNTVDTMLQDFTLGKESQGKHVLQLMPFFFILASNTTNLNKLKIKKILQTVAQQAHRGNQVFIESTPFGNQIFINSLSRGIVSNVLGIDGCLLLTDARTIIGCEGGPIYAADSKNDSKDGRKLVGLVSCPLTWWRGEWVGLTIGVSLLPVAKRLLSNDDDDILKMKDGIQNEPSLIDETVVLVRCGSSWGTGLIINAQKGLVLTCSHVVHNGNNLTVWIVHRGTLHKSIIVYRTRDDFAYDIAILKLTTAHSFTKEIRLSDAHLHPQKGEDVVAAGFALFSERDSINLSPTLVKGCIAHVHPFMLQTTCCIQSGASGGPILTPGPQHKLIGLIVSNAQDRATGVVFPHVNFAIPVDCFRAQIEEFIKTDDVSHLNSLESDKGAVQAIWKLQTSKL